MPAHGRCQGASGKGVNPLSSARLVVIPRESLLDETVHLRVEGLVPGSRARLRCSLHDEKSLDWVSEAEYLADEEGKVDTGTNAPVSGSYEGIDPDGLFWSMVPDSLSPDRGKFSLHDLSPLVFDVEASSGGGIVDRSWLTRRVATGGLRREDVREGDLVGTLFLPPGPGPHPGVVDVVHSGGGLRHEPYAALLASRGFAVMALATFGIPPLSRGLVEIPLERLEKALARLAEHPCVDANRLAVTGTSKGAELALLGASMFERVKAVVAFMPTCVLWSGVGRGYEKRPSWTWRGKPLPFVSPRYDRLAPRGEGPLRLEPMYREALEGVGADHPARIPLERSRGAILLLSPGDDAVMPAALMGLQLEQRLSAAGFPHPFRHVVYPGAGHMIGSDLLPGLPTSIRHTFHPLARFPIAYGGSAAKTAEAARLSWEEMLRFLRENL